MHTLDKERLKLYHLIKSLYRRRKVFKCPNCGTKLTLTLVVAEEGAEEGLPVPAKSPVAPTGRLATFRIASKSYSLSDQDIYQAAKTLDYPETIRRYCVELPDKRGKIEEFPIKQVVRKALKTKYPDEFTETYFTAHRVRDILRKLGFAVKERY
jgi:hypothetical protein